MSALLVHKTNAAVSFQNKAESFQWNILMYLKFPLVLPSWLEDQEEW